MNFVSMFCRFQG